MYFYWKAAAITEEDEGSLAPMGGRVEGIHPPYRGPAYEMRSPSYPFLAYPEEALDCLQLSELVQSVVRCIAQGLTRYLMCEVHDPIDMQFTCFLF